MDRYVVVGHPVEHSQSPFIHAMFAALCNDPIDYQRRLSPLDGFEACVRDFAESGGRGCNVTVPFKFDAFRIATRRSPRAALAGAANVLRLDGSECFADNADGIGLVRDIEVNASTPLAGRRVLMLGAGGAAAGALGPLLAAGPAELVLANRTASNAQALIERHAEIAAKHRVRLKASGLVDIAAGFDVLINATATSLAGDAVPVSPHVLKPGCLALDMMYGDAARGFLDWASSRGATARDGLGMLVEQAADSFLLWRGMRPDTAPVLAALRSRLAATANASAP